jgi:hypothetical protein
VLTQSTISTLPTMPPVCRVAGNSIPCRLAKSSPAGSMLREACIKIRPRRFVDHVRFSTGLCPLTISHAHGCFTLSAFTSTK